MTALPFVIIRQAEDEVFRKYMADGIRLLTEGLAGQQSGCLRPWAEVLDPPPEDTRTGEEIAVGILSKLRGDG